MSYNFKLYKQCNFNIRVSQIVVMWSEKSESLLPDRGLTRPGRGNPSEPRPAEAEQAVVGGEPSPHPGPRGASEAMDSAMTGTLPAQGVTLREAMSQEPQQAAPSARKPPCVTSANRRCYHSVCVL